MMGDVEPGGDGQERFLAASDWFARMRGDQAASLRDDFEAWMADPANAAAYREMEAIWSASSEASPRVGRRRPVYLRPGLIAAGVAVALAIGFLVVQANRRSETSGIATYSSEGSKIRTIRLADGSRVTLDSSSEMRVDLGGDERRVVLLSGRARFFVAHDREHPFVVTVGDDAVVARGTVFDVRATPGATEVALIEGAVDLERRERAAPPRLLGSLRPGQQARFGANDSEPAIAPASVEPWTVGLRAGEDMRLAAIVTETNRYGTRKIVLADPALGDLRIAGAFKPSQTDDVVEAIAAAFDLTVARAPSGDIVLSRRQPVPVTRRASCLPTDFGCSRSAVA